jgi:hypothetical protein
MSLDVVTAGIWRSRCGRPGSCLRCPSCGGMQLRLVQSTERAWLDLGGIQMLQIPAGAEV